MARILSDFDRAMERLRLEGELGRTLTSQEQTQLREDQYSRNAKARNELYDARADVACCQMDYNWATDPAKKQAAAIALEEAEIRLRKLTWS